MLVRALLVSIALFSACDSQSPPPEPPDGLDVSTGTFTARLNNAPFEAPAVLRAGNGGVSVEASVLDSVTYHSVDITLSYLEPTWTVGEYPLAVLDESGAQLYGAVIGEGEGDIAVQLYLPLPDAPGEVVVEEADAQTGRFTARLSGTFVATGDRHPYQTLADTIRVTGGRFHVASPE